MFIELSTYYYRFVYVNWNYKIGCFSPVIILVKVFFFFVMQNIMHTYDHETALKNLSQLFSEQFEKVRWLFLPVCARNHWILFAYDLKRKQVRYFTSAGETNGAYVNCAWHTTMWIDSFLAWRLRELLLNNYG